MSRTKRHKSQLDQGIDWGAKRMGDKRYHGKPCHEFKKFTSRKERLRDKRDLSRLAYSE